MYKNNTQKAGGQYYFTIYSMIIFFLVVAVEPVGLAPGLLPFQKALGVLDGFVFQSPAAYGTADPAVCIHQHVGARTSGAGTYFGYNRSQYRILAGGDLFKY
jgi:hypothetical protein